MAKVPIAPKPLPPFPRLEQFLFASPLYAEYQLSEDLNSVRQLTGRVRTLLQTNAKATVDGYCARCARDSTFTVEGFSVTDTEYEKIKSRYGFERFNITCARQSAHKITFFVLLNQLKIQKVGQLPSLADIAIDETRQKYKTVLKGDNWSEFYKAIGLAAHGEGIGSFVYLRRVFERLIQSRFEAFKDAEGWNVEEFNKLRMDERVGFLKNHLPPYLVEIKRIYSIFSRGIHELDNETCLEFFEVGKRSIMIVLEDDLKHSQEMQARREMAAAVAKFGGSKSDSNEDGGNQGVVTETSENSQSS